MLVCVLLLVCVSLLILFPKLARALIYVVCLGCAGSWWGDEVGQKVEGGWVGTGGREGVRCAARRTPLLNNYETTRAQQQQQGNNSVDVHVHTHERARMDSLARSRAHNFGRTRSCCQHAYSR